MPNWRSAGAIALCSAFIWGMAGAAIAQDVRVRVPAQPLSDSLNDVARQTGADVLFSPEIVAGMRAPAVRGEMSAEQAIARLIARQPLEIVRDAGGAFIIRARTPSSPRAPIPQRRAEAEEPLADIVITATRRESALSETPMSVSVLDELLIEERAIATVRDVRRIVPGLNMTETNTGQRRITIRGLQSAGETTVGFYYGDTPISGPSTATADPSAMTPDLDLYDVARIEVLRGPQGTLYGAGSLSGALRIIPSMPSFDAVFGEIEAAGQAVEGGGVGGALRGFVNVPLVDDRLALRVTGYTEESPGFIDNARLDLDDVNVMQTDGARLAVTWRASNDLSFDLSALQQSQTVEDTDYWYPDVGVNRTDNYVRLPYATNIGLYNGTMRWTPGDLELVASLSSYDWDATRYIDGTRAALDVIGPATHCPLYFNISNACDATQAEAYRDYVRGVLPVVGIQPMSVETRTGEMRVSSSDAGQFDWTIGAFRETRADRSISTAVSADAATGLPIQPYLIRFARTTSMEISHEALFGELTYRPIEELALTLGARRYWYEKETGAQVLQTSYLVGTAAGPLSVVESADEGWVHRANISYTPSDDLIIYAQYAEGFRPGGANTTPSLPDIYRTYASDAVRSLELGVRASWFDGRIDLSGAIYRVDWDAMQMAVKIPNFRFVANIGASVIEGAEAEIEARLSEDWTLRAGVGANNGRLTEDQSVGEMAGSGESGDRIPLEPEVMAYVGVRYDWLGPLDLAGVLNIDVVYTGESTSEFDAEGEYFERMGNVTTVDAQASLSGVHWRGSLWVSNVFDVVAESMVGSGVNSEQFTLGVRPRTVGISLTRAF